jgi:hypothetical protein
MVFRLASLGNQQNLLFCTEGKMCHLPYYRRSTLEKREEENKEKKEEK